jgi:hypothetical protein
MIYVHSAVSSTKKGALRLFKEMYVKASPEQQRNCIRIHVLQQSTLVSVRMFMAEKCSKEARKIFEKIHVHAK